MTISPRPVHCTGAMLMLCFALLIATQAKEIRIMRYKTEESSSAIARLEIHAERRAPRPVSRRLFGKFSEHLGTNVYNGMWSQILRNPGFEDEEKFHSARLHQRLAGIEHRWGVRGLVRAPAHGVAPYWVAHGDGVHCALDSGAVNSDHCQRLTHSDDVGRCGIEQAVFLPIHRVAEYDLSMWARGRGVGSLEVSILSHDRTVAAAEISNLTSQWKRYQVRLTVTARAPRPGELFRLRVAFADKGTLWLDQMFLFPDDNIDGFDPDVVRLWREARLPLLRFPGGNFVSGYHWRDGIGPVDQRPTKPNPAWDIVEYNHVGTDEMMRFCKAVGAEPMICVNAGNGTPDEAAAWVEYCNGDEDTEFGAMRARNGHPAPYNVRLWEIGNELYGKWQIGHCDAATYAERYAEFARAMRAKDSTIRLIANGDTPEWNAELVKRYPDLARSFSVHSLIGGGAPPDSDPTRVFRALMAYTYGYPKVLLARSLAARRAGLYPKLAITELQVFTKRQGLPTNATLTEALWTASILNVGIRSLGGVELITHSALINHGGGLRKQYEFVWPQPVYFTHKLYATQSGVRPMEVRYAGAFVRGPRIRGISCPQKAPLLDAVALASEDGSEINLLVVNRSLDHAQRTRLVFHGFAPERSATVRTLTGPSFLAQNTFEHPHHVHVQEKRASLGGDPVYTFPAHSLTVLVFRAQ